MGYRNPQIAGKIRSYSQEELDKIRIELEDICKTYNIAVKFNSHTGNYTDLCNAIKETTREDEITERFLKDLFTERTIGEQNIGRKKIEILKKFITEKISEKKKENVKIDTLQENNVTENISRSVDHQELLSTQLSAAYLKKISTGITMLSNHLATVAKPVITKNDTKQEANLKNIVFKKPIKGKLIDFDSPKSSIEYCFKLAEIMKEADDPESAIRYSDIIILYDPRFALAHYIRAHSYFRLDNYNEALKSAKRLIRLEPFFGEGLNLLAVIYHFTRQYLKAYRVLGIGITYTQKDKLILYSDILRRTNLKIESKHFFKSKTGIYRMYLFNKYMVCTLMGRHEEALKAADEASQITKGGDKYLYLEFKLYPLLALKRHNESLQLCKKLIKRNPKNGLLWYYYSKSLAKTNGEKEQILNSLGKALELSATIKHFVEGSNGSKALFYADDFVIFFRELSSY